MINADVDDKVIIHANHHEMDTTRMDVPEDSHILDDEDDLNFKKRGRPLGRSIRHRNKGYMEKETKCHLKMIDWRSLTKEECLGRMTHLPQGLNLFDVTRAPRILTGDVEQMLNQKTRLSETGLTEDLSCPICMGTYQNVAVVKDCLHRFCAECIERWLRTGHQDCPKCRNRIPSRRSLRADPIFERIVRRLFPDVVSFEALNDRAVAAANQRKTGVSVCFQETNRSGRCSATRLSIRKSARAAKQQQIRSSVLPESTSPPVSRTLKVKLIPNEGQREIDKLKSVVLAPLKIISIKQLKKMIIVAGGLPMDFSLNLRVSTTTEPLLDCLKLNDVVEMVNESSAIQLYVSKNSAAESSKFESAEIAQASSPPGKRSGTIDSDAIPKKCRTSESSDHAMNLSLREESKTEFHQNITLDEKDGESSNSKEGYYNESEEKAVNDASTSESVPDDSIRRIAELHGQHSHIQEIYSPISDTESEIE